MRHAAEEQLNRRSLRDIEALLTQLVAAAVDMIPGATGGGISRTEVGTVRSTHATSEVIHDLDEAQSKNEQGPCISAADEPPPDGVILVRDLAGTDGERWPRFAPIAVKHGFRSMLSTNLSSFSNIRRSALNLYGPGPDAFDDADKITAGLFAIQASSLIYGADEAAALIRALGSRDVIGQAKGVLIERFGVDSDGAFEMLVTSSQDNNMKLSVVAEWLVNETIANRRQQRAVHET